MAATVPIPGVINPVVPESVHDFGTVHGTAWWGVDGFRRRGTNPRGRTDQHDGNGQGEYKMHGATFLRSHGGGI